MLTWHHVVFFLDSGGSKCLGHTIWVAVICTEPKMKIFFNIFIFLKISWIQNKFCIIIAKIISLKISLFWDLSQGMSLSSFPPKKQASNLLTNLVYQLEACFFGGKPLELMTILRSHKKLTLVTVYKVVLTTLLCLSVWCAAIK